MNDFWHNQHEYMLEQDIAELEAIRRQYLANDQDAEVWNQADWQDFERDRVEFERRNEDLPF